MTVRTKVWTTFAVILVLALLAGLVDYPKGPNIRIGSWFREIKVHLGLDLQGGAQLIYEADVSKIEAVDRVAAIEGTNAKAESTANEVLAKAKAGEDFVALADQYTEDPSNTGTDGSKKGGDLDYRDPNI